MFSKIELKIDKINFEWFMKEKIINYVRLNIIWFKNKWKY